MERLGALLDEVGARGHRAPDRELVKLLKARHAMTVSRRTVNEWRNEIEKGR
jgi:DNA-directed RNA polymerase specialized sigma54-like protein